MNPICESKGSSKTLVSITLRHWKNSWKAVFASLRVSDTLERRYYWAFWVYLESAILPSSIFKLGLSGSFPSVPDRELTGKKWMIHNVWCEKSFLVYLCTFRHQSTTKRWMNFPLITVPNWLKTVSAWKHSLSKHFSLFLFDFGLQYNNNSFQLALTALITP